ncbi:hypothetical protein ACTFIR_005951 [Dictyostelium discoideum]
MSSSTIITPIANTTTTNNNSSTNGIHNSKTNRTLFKNIKNNNIPNSPNNAPIKKNSVGIIGNGPNVNNNNNKDRKLNSNDGVNFGKKNILFTPSKNSMVSTTKHSSSSLLAKNEYDIESIKKELKSMDISTGGISPLSSPLRESSPISTIDLESITATTTTKLTDAFVAASSSSSSPSVKYTIDVLLSFKSANTKRPIQIDIVENHQKEIVVPLSLPTTPYNTTNTNNNSSQHNTANGQKYPIFSPQISPFKIAYAQSSSTKTNNNNNITPTKKANSNITTPQSNNRNNHYNSNTKSSTKKQNPIPFSLNTATPNQKNTTTTPSKKSTTTTPKSNKKINDVNAAFAAVANSTTTTTTEQPVAIIDGATPTNESPKKTPLKETDPKRLAARQRQIDIGKMTAGYKNYIALVPKSKRKPTDPKTPNKNQVCSKRSWDGQIKKWRRQLHENYDWTGIPFNEKEVEASNNESTEESTLEKEMNKLEISEENENHNN